MKTIPIAELRRRLSYNPKTGEFRWRVSTQGHKAGATAGSRMVDGRAYITIAGERYYAHRLAWAWVTGQQPPEVDHRNRRHDDNRLAKLRVATRVENNANKDKRGGTSKYKGVYRLRSGKWRARATSQYENVHLGYFDKEVDAARAYNAFARREWGAFAVLNEVA